MAKAHDQQPDLDLTRGVFRRVYAGMITGKRICSISLVAEAWFWRIHAVADDFGNALADPVLLRNATAGRRGDVTAEQVEGWVQELVGANLITLYEAGGERYLHVVDFEVRQPAAGRNGRRIQRHPLHPDPKKTMQSNAPKLGNGATGCIQGNPGAAGCSRVQPGASGCTQGRPTETSAPSNETENDTESENDTEKSPPAPGGEGPGGKPKGKTSKGKSQKPESEIPEKLNTPEFRKAWGEWEQYHRERRKPLQPSTIRKQIAKCETLGPSTAADWIDNSITQGWTGIFEPSPKRSNANGNGQHRPNRIGTVENLSFAPAVAGT